MKIARFSKCSWACCKNKPWCTQTNELDTAARMDSTKTECSIKLKFVKTTSLDEILT